MSYAENLKCSICGKTYPLNKLFTCDCKGVLTVDYNFEALRNELDYKKFGKGETLIECYRWLLPVRNPERAVSLGEGGTPLLKCNKLSERLGLKKIYLKDDSRTPSGSFKDRAISVGTTVAREEGVKTVVIASTGNAATSLSAYSAVAGFRCVVLVPERASAAKLAQSAIYGSEIISVKGSVDAALGLLKAANEKWGWTPMPTSAAYNPRQTEGAKTSSYEIFQCLEDSVPDYIIVPVGGGDNLYAITRGFHDLYNLDLINRLPKMIGVQAANCAPLVKAFEAGNDEIKAVSQPVTVASGIRVGYPPTGLLALKAIKDTGGFAIMVEDNDILEAQKDLARTEGIFAEPSSTVTVAALKKLVKEKVIDRDELVVNHITGHGLKEFDVLSGSWTMPAPIEANIEVLEKALKKS